MINKIFRGRGNQGGGRGSGIGGGAGRGGGRGQGGGTKPGAGPGGFCVCPSCGERTPHQVGSRCLDQKCPKCGTQMVRG